jgi:hypothetical protein
MTLVFVATGFLILLIGSALCIGLLFVVRSNSYRVSLYIGSIVFLSNAALVAYQTRARRSSFDLSEVNRGITDVYVYWVEELQLSSIIFPTYCILFVLLLLYFLYRDFTR